MHKIFLFFYFLLFILFLYFLKMNKSKINISAAYAGATFGLLFYYILIPFLIILFQDEIIIKYDIISNYVIDREFMDYTLALVLIFTGFIVFHYSYKFGFKYKIEFKMKREKKKRFSNVNFQIIKIFEIFGYVTFLLGGISFAIIILKLGGISSTLSIAEKFRGFSGDVALSDFLGTTIALFFIPARLVTVAPLIFCFLMLNRKKIRDKIIFLISFPYAILFFLFNAGRTPLILFLLCFLYLIMKEVFTKVWGKLIIAGIFALPLLDLLDKVFIYFSTNVWYPVKVDYITNIYQFSHPIKSVLNLRDMVDIEKYNFGSSIFKDLLDILPKINFDPVYFDVSKYFYGEEWKNIGGIPTDIITYGYYQLGIVGVWFILFLFGIFCGKIDRLITYLPQSRSKELVTVIIATNIFAIISTVDLGPLIRGNVILVSIIIILMLSSKYLRRINLETNKTSSNSK